MGKKEGEFDKNVISEGSFKLLKQMIDSLENLDTKLEEFYKRNNQERVTKTAQAILDVQEEIAEVLK
ncbi:MAG TPA: hypothetical protein PLK34_02550 [Candidatus Pacearchaeota archaeon]|nr:hypothetical protein [Candidatus Pacearchaeota archaeon]